MNRYEMVARGSSIRQGYRASVPALFVTPVRVSPCREGGGVAAEDEVVWMFRGAWVSLCFRAMCVLCVVDALDERQSLVELAARTSDPATLARLLRVLVDLELLVVADDGRYTATPRIEVLRVDHPSGVRSLALMQTVTPT
jgi:hypothetical protein